MLRGSEDSAAVAGDVERAVRRAEGWSAGALRSLLEGLEGREPLVAYSGRGAIPALVFRWMYQAVAAKPLQVMEAEAVAYHVLPYGEDYRILHFASTGREGSLVRLADAAYLTGSRIVIVSPPLREPLSSKLRGFRVIEVPEDLGYVVAASLLALKAAFRCGAGRSGRVGKRASRLEVEVDDVAGVARDVVLTYWGSATEACRALLSGADVVVAYTPTMEAPARLLAEVSYSVAGRLIPVLPVSGMVEKVSGGSAIIAFSTGVEEDSLRELRYRAATSMAKLVEFRVNTDPATAQVYGLVIGEALHRMLRRAAEAGRAGRGG